MVVPHPLYKNPPKLKSSHPSELFGRSVDGKSRNLPQNVLVLRVQFSDVYFSSVAAYPDNLVHDKAFFERWMIHLADFYGDASSHRSPQPYAINYTVPDVVFNLPNTMAYYGGDTSEASDAKVPDMILETIQMADPTIDFSLYDAIIVFHAGAGQESDVNSIRTGQIWSTFMSRSDFQEAFDPENDNYPGIQTSDGTIVKELVLIPESEFQDYFPGPDDPNASAYLFSIYGVLCHQFGHQLGLPTLFDNVSSNGRSQGIGNWGLMGTGVWNGNGNVPAQLDAWSRYYLGWENAQTISYNAQDLTLDYFLDRNPSAQRLYKIPISDKEYFLIENRQQNPDQSVDPYNGQPSFTFTLLGPEEQDYYPAPDSLLPYFNFMENRYKGCEWDFFLPGLGGPLRPGESAPVDGSGIIIWHIDENVIEENFSPNFDYNHVNGDASHKGVDVEEADGIQQLDTAVFDYYKYGGPFDTFRADISNPDASNTYFGNETYNNLLHLPTAASYYGGIPLEIYNITQSGLQMTFSVNVSWKLDTGYTGINNLDACSIDYDNDDENEIFYPMPDGEMFLWKDEAIATGFPITAPGKIDSYVWDSNAIYLALDMTTNPDSPVYKLDKLQNGHLTDVLTLQNGYRLAAPIMSFNNYLAVPVNNYIDGEFFNWNVKLYDKDNLPQIVDSWGLGTDSIVTNLAYFKQKVYAVTKSEFDGAHKVNIMTHGTEVFQNFTLPVPVDSIVVAMSCANITPGGSGDLVIQTPFSVYLTDLTGNVRSGFPKTLSFYCDSPVTISDFDNNQSFDILIGGENSFTVLDYAGENILTNFTGLSSPDTLDVTAGVIAGDFDGDEEQEVMGAFSRNRLAAWDNNQRLISGFPVSFSERSRNLPFIHKASDNQIYAWIPTDNGKIFRAGLLGSAAGIDDNWYCKYANLNRTAAREDVTNPGYPTDAVFIPDEVFVFPNPLKAIYEQKMTFQIMTSRDVNVDVSIHDISGAEIFQKKIQCKAWLKNRERVDFPVDHLSSGVYIAVFKSGNNIKRIKFAVEK